jgi:phenylpyruvate tautomerase PptA (4-oxalocrotonate tautomerase family)
MPIVDVRPVVSSTSKLPVAAAQSLADSIAQVLGAQIGRVWVRVAEIPDETYAENGASVRDNELPVFVQVLHAEWPIEEVRVQQSAALSAAVATCMGREVSRVHIEYAPPGRGRIAFGGKLVV